MDARACWRRRRDRCRRVARAGKEPPPPAPSAYPRRARPLYSATSCVRQACAEINGGQLESLAYPETESMLRRMLTCVLSRPSPIPRRPAAPDCWQRPDTFRRRCPRPSDGCERQRLEAPHLPDLRRQGLLTIGARSPQLPAPRGKPRATDGRDDHLPLRFVRRGLCAASGIACPPCRASPRQSTSASFT